MPRIQLEIGILPCDIVVVSIVVVLVMAVSGSVVMAVGIIVVVVGGSKPQGTTHRLLRQAPKKFGQTAAAVSRRQASPEKKNRMLNSRTSNTGSVSVMHIQIWKLSAICYH